MASNNVPLRENEDRHQIPVAKTCDEKENENLTVKFSKLNHQAVPFQSRSCPLQVEDFPVVASSTYAPRIPTGTVYYNPILTHTDTSVGSQGDVATAKSRTKPRLDPVASGFSHESDDESMKLSRINGMINRMTKEELQEKMHKMRLNTCGSKDVLKKRLKNHYKKQRLSHCQKSASEEKIKFRYFVVIDFEATCSETNEDFIHEIIEFPAVLVDTSNMAVCNVFQRFCKPRLNPILTEFCKDLTGISQDQVDKAKDFKEVFTEFEEWLALHKLGTEHKFAILTDGPWDMARFLKTQIDVSEISFPSWAKSWINLRKAYSAFYGVGRVNLQHMLDDLGMSFQGRPHCGLDDSRNIANIAVRLLQDGCLMRINEYLYENGRSPPHHHHRKFQASAAQGHSRQAAEVVIPQEGDNMADLFDLIHIQNS